MLRSEGLGPSTAVTVFLVALAVAILALVGPGSGPAHADITFTVNSNGDGPDANLSDTPNACDADSGTTGDQCTLRAAIQEANATSGADTIDFNIPDSQCDATTKVCTIRPSSVPPRIFEQVTINGYSQPGSSANTLATGTNAKPLIELDGANPGIGGNGPGLDIEAPNVTVKGLVIDGFANNYGIFISPRAELDDATNIRIEGNFIGTDPSGTLDRANAYGIYISSGTSNTVGGTQLAARNLISGNRLGGVLIEGNPTFGPSTNNVVEGNLIGPERDGTSAMGNGAGDGVSVAAFSTADTSNRILSNTIFSNGDLGIDLGDDGATPNDPGDADTGANNQQNFPLISSARTSRTATTIKGALNARPGAIYTVQLFSNPPSTDEGAKLIGQRSVILADSSGNASFTFKTKKKVGVGQAITATATNEFTGDTSEFSAPVAVRRG